MSLSPPPAADVVMPAQPQAESPHDEENDPGKDIPPDEDVVQRFRQTLLNARMAQYIVDFEEQAEMEKVRVGAVPQSVLDKVRADKHVAWQKRLAEEQEKQREILLRLSRQAEAAQRNIIEQGEKLIEEEKKRDQQLKGQPKAAKWAMRAWFQQSRERMASYIKSRANNLRHVYGELKVEDEHSWDSRQVNWRRIPQQVEIRVQGIRGVKDRISPDTYVMLLSKWTCIGGENLRWSRRNVYSEEPPYCPLHPIHRTKFEKREACEVCQGWVGCTEPQWHGGTYKDVELIFNSAMRCHFPPVATIKPYMVLLFELVRIEDPEAHELRLETVQYRKPRRKSPYELAPSVGGRGSTGVITGKRSRTVAWGAFPVINSKFNLIKGKYKCPLLRGEIDPKVRHFRTFEQLLHTDLENWLGNIYFEFIPFPREKDGKGEFDLDQRFSRELLGLDRFDDEYWNLDDHANWIAAKERLHTAQYYRPLPATAQGRPRTAYQEKVVRPSTAAKVLDSDTDDQMTDSGREISASAASEEAPSEPSEEPSKEEAASVSQDSVPRTSSASQSKKTGVWVPAHVRHQLHSRHKRMEIGDDPSDDASVADSLVAAEKERLRRRDFRKPQPFRIDRAEKWSRYRFSIEPDGTFAEHDYRWYVQLQYVVRAILDELNLRHPTSLKFYFILALFWVAMWGQLYLRGIGIYSALQMLRIPIAKVTPYYHGLISEYKAHYMWPFDEIFIICWAGFVNVLMILFLCGVGLLFRRGTGTFPEQLSKFVYLFSLNTYLIPFVNIIVDLYNHEQDSDIKRLIRFYVTKRYSVFFAGITFGVLYLLSVVVITVIIFRYTMYLHLNGIIVDSYVRINVVTEQKAEQLFLPNDFEVSMRELEYVVDRAERWRGAYEERRKVMVEESITTDEDHPGWYEIQVRIAIYTLDVTDKRLKPRRIFREFFVLHSGAVVEAVNNKQPPSAAFIVSATEDFYFSREVQAASVYH